MKYTQAQHEEVRRSVERLFRDVAARFAHAQVRSDAPGPAGENLIELSCSLPGTSKVTALPGADQIDLYLGKATWLEIMPSRRKPEKLLDQVREVVEAVVAGGFGERVREVDGEVIGAKSTLHRAQGKPLVSRHSRLSAKVLFRGHRDSIRYAPYG